MRIPISILVVLLLSTSVYAENGKVALVNGYICTSKIAVVRLHEYLMRPQLKFSVNAMFEELDKDGYNCSKGRGKLLFHKKTDSFLRSDGRTIHYLEFWDPITRKKLYSWRTGKEIAL